MKKPEAMPLEALLDDPGFERNCALLLDPETLNPTASPKLTRAIASLVVSGAVKRAESKRQQSAANTAGGRALKKPTVTRATLEANREEFIYRTGGERGWIKAVCLEFGITANTVRARMKENE